MFSESPHNRIIFLIYQFIIRLYKHSKNSLWIYFVLLSKQKSHLNMLYICMYLYICIYSDTYIYKRVCTLYIYINKHVRIYIYAFIHAHSISLLRVEIKRGGNFKKSRVVIEWKGKEESNLWVYISCWLPRLMAHSFSTPGLKVFPFFPKLFFFFHSFAEPFSLLPPTNRRRPMHSGWIEIPIEPFNPLFAGQI